MEELFTGNNASGVTHTLDRVILESLYTNYASWKTTIPTVDLTPYASKTYVDTALMYYATTVDVQNYMPLAGGGFSGDVSLNTYSLKFTNATKPSWKLCSMGVPTVLF